MRSFQAALLILSVAVPVYAQERAPEKLFESIEVRVVNVDVVVRDHAGNPVTGLTKDDFEVFDNGQKQELTNIYEIRTSGSTLTAAASAAVGGTATPAIDEPPVELRQRKLIVFIDNYSILPMRRNAIFKSLEKFVETTMRPGDQTMLVFWNHDLEVITPFTSDRELLHQGIASLSQRSNAGFADKQAVDHVKSRIQQMVDAARSSNMSWEDAFTQATSAIDIYAEGVTMDSQRMIDALRRTTSTLAGLDGKKVLVLAGAHLPERPGAELHMWLYNLITPFARLSNASTTQQLGATFAAKTSFETALLNSVGGSIGNMQRLWIRDAAREASANGVTLYTIDAADSRDAVSAESANFIDESEKFTTYVNSAAAYKTLAKITGGVAITNTDNFDMAFRTIAADLDSYYSLGYKPSETSRTGQQRKLVIKLKNPAYRVRSREMYSQKTTDEQMDDHVLSNIFNTDVHGEWPVEIHAGTPTREGRNYRVPVQVTLAPSVTLLPLEKDLVGGFTLYIAVGNQKGAMSDVTRNPRRLRIPLEAEKQLRSKPMTFDAVIMMSPGENTLSVGILDQISSTTGFARTKIAAK